MIEREEKKAQVGIMKKINEMQKRTDDILYKIGMILILLMILFFLAARIFPINKIIFQWRCIINFLTGYYCPGCGGTRAFYHLLRGNIIASVKTHPVIIYGAGMFILYMASNTIEKVTKGKVAIGMKYKDYYIWIGFILLIINFICQNIMIFLTGSPGWKIP